MRSWTKNRLAITQLAIALLLGLLALLTRDVALTIPSLLGRRAFAGPVSFFFPIIIVMLFAWSLSRAPVRLEAPSRRPTRLGDLALGGSVLLACLTPALIIGSGTTLPLVRNAATGLGLMFCCTRLLPTDLASLPVAGWILASALAGHNYGRDAWWSWPVMNTQDPLSWAWMIIALATGALLHLTDRRLTQG